MHDFLANQKTLELQSSDAPLVLRSVLVDQDRVEFALRCLRSIANWVDVPHEVIVEQTLEGVIGPRVAEPAVGKYVLYLSSYAELQVGAVRSAVEILEREPDVGAVGAKIIGDDGTLLEAGCYLKEKRLAGSVWQGPGALPIRIHAPAQCAGCIRNVPDDAARSSIRTARCRDYCLKLW